MTHSLESVRDCDPHRALTSNICRKHGDEEQLWEGAQWAPGGGQLAFYGAVIRIYPLQRWERPCSAAGHMDMRILKALRDSAQLQCSTESYTAQGVRLRSWCWRWTC